MSTTSDTRKPSATQGIFLYTAPAGAMSHTTEWRPRHKPARDSSCTLAITVGPDTERLSGRRRDWTCPEVCVRGLPTCSVCEYSLCGFCGQICWLAVGTGTIHTLLVTSDWSCGSLGEYQQTVSHPLQSLLIMLLSIKALQKDFLGFVLVCGPV